MEADMLSLHYGSAVRGEQRFSRPTLERRLMMALDGGAGIKMFGLRRIGKSTLKQHAVEQFAIRGRPCAVIDGQGLGSLSDLLGRLFAEFQVQDGFAGRVVGLMTSGPARGVVEAIATGAGHEAATLSIYWQAASSAIRRALEAGGTRPVLVIDELTFLLKNMIERDPKNGRADAERLLAAMREWRGDGMTMLLTGSIGLTALARKHGLSAEHINDLQPFDVPELTEAEARAFIREATEQPSQGRWTAAHTDELLRQVGSLYPCFLVKALQEIGVSHPVPPGAFGAIFAEHVRPLLNTDFISQFRHRFASYGDLPDARRETLILPALEVIMPSGVDGCDGDAIPCAAGFNRSDLAEALDMLTEDGFVRFTEDEHGDQRWRPASSIARLWWRRAKLVSPTAAGTA
jgi:hypothetical protein